jgi:dihydropteroate synthase
LGFVFIIANWKRKFLKSVKPMTINCKGQLVDLSTPKVMGILNVTPDSFFDGGKFNDEAKIVAHVGQMLSEGADFIDIGGYSSKPNTELVSEAEELARILPVVKLVLAEFPNTLISVDTFRSGIAKACIENGAAIVNDISAGMLDTKMMQVISELQVPYIMMHMRGTPQTMQQLTQYEEVMREVLFYFSQRIAEARKLGINDIIIDPGFGFAKTMAQNYELLQKLELFNNIDLPLLVGLSRKSMVYKPLESDAQSSLNGTTVLNTVALTKGAKILRVHDVGAAVECIKLTQMISGN